MSSSEARFRPGFDQTPGKLDLFPTPGANLFEKICKFLRRNLAPSNKVAAYPFACIRSM